MRPPRRRFLVRLLFPFSFSFGLISLVIALFSFPFALVPSRMTRDLQRDCMVPDARLLFLLVDISSLLCFIFHMNATYIDIM